MPGRQVESMAEIDTSDVPIPGEAAVIGPQIVRAESPDRGGSHEKAVLVVMEPSVAVSAPGSIVVHQDRALDVVAASQEILVFEIRDTDPLISPASGIESAVRVLL